MMLYPLQETIECVRKSFTLNRLKKLCIFLLTSNEENSLSYLKEWNTTSNKINFAVGELNCWYWNTEFNHIHDNIKRLHSKSASLNILNVNNVEYTVCDVNTSQTLTAAGIHRSSHVYPCVPPSIIFRQFGWPLGHRQSELAMILRHNDLTTVALRSISTVSSTTNTPATGSTTHALETVGPRSILL